MKYLSNEKIDDFTYYYMSFSDCCPALLLAVVFSCLVFIAAVLAVFENMRTKISKRYWYIYFCHRFYFSGYLWNFFNKTCPMLVVAIVSLMLRNGLLKLV